MIKRPTAAHRAITRPGKRGRVKVILTTNFGRMMERALQEAGISPADCRADRMRSIP
ncbi:hypothetical protein [Streptomyces chartreusis]|uniref:hypothetical protein n=1 Tax=Streptomyces chartreusis TaxID=1969 RepID=UPI0037FFA9A5